MAAYLARNDYLSLYVTLEQGSSTLAAKVLSARMFSDFGVSKSSQDITKKKSRASFTYADEQALFAAADKVKREVADNLIFAQFKSKPSGSQIAELAKDVLKYCWAAGKKGVVVFVDYLQILASEDVRMNERQAIDSNIAALIHMSRDFGIPCILISSLNRTSYYKGPITTSSFKESGAIEYSSDCLLAIEPNDDKLEGDFEKVHKGLSGEQKRIELFRFMKRRPVHHLKVSVLKQRNGAIPPDPVELAFVPAISTFIDTKHDARGNAYAKQLLDDCKATHEAP